MVETKYGDRQVRELWTQLEKKVPKFFQGIQIVPALLHGDLWFGNKAEVIRLTFTLFMIKPYKKIQKDDRYFRYTLFYSKISKQ